MWHSADMNKTVCRSKNISTFRTHCLSDLQTFVDLESVVLEAAIVDEYYDEYEYDYEEEDFDEEELETVALEAEDENDLCYEDFYYY